ATGCGHPLKSAVAPRRTPRQAGAFGAATARGSVGDEAQVVRLQDGLQRLEVAARPLVLAAAGPAAAGQHALRLAGPGDERATRVAAFRARGGAGEIED